MHTVVDWSIVYPCFLFCLTIFTSLLYLVGLTSPYCSSKRPHSTMGVRGALKAGIWGESRTYHLLDFDWPVA